MLKPYLCEKRLYLSSRLIQADDDVIELIFRDHILSYSSIFSASGLTAVLFKLHALCKLNGKTPFLSYDYAEQ